jgi:hypothetical protein
MGRQSYQQVDAELRARAAFLGQDLLEEMLSRAWDESGYSDPLGPEAGEARTACGQGPGSFDDLDDYHGYSETCTWDGASFTRQVQVCYTDASAPDECLASGTTDYKKITVRLSSQQLGSLSFSTLRAKLQ